MKHLTHLFLIFFLVLSSCTSDFQMSEEKKASEEIEIHFAVLKHLSDKYAGDLCFISFDGKELRMSPKLYSPTLSRPLQGV